MNPSTLRRWLLLSAIANLFFVAAIGGGAWRWWHGERAATAAAAQARGLRYAADDLGPERRQAYRAGLRTARREAASSIQAAREGRQDVLKQLAAPQFDRAAAARGAGAHARGRHRVAQRAWKRACSISPPPCRRRSASNWPRPGQAQHAGAAGERRVKTPARSTEMLLRPVEEGIGGNMSASPASQNAAVALNRFGLVRVPASPGPKIPAPGCWRSSSATTRGRRPGAASQAAPSWCRLTASTSAACAGRTNWRRGRSSRASDRIAIAAAVTARTASALATAAPFAERLVHFWANHFAVSIDKAPLALLAGSFEAEAIRPHVFGRFEDMLLAVERHPAMLLYLDQARSDRPGQPRGPARAAGAPRGLNENLAREILELHTLACAAATPGGRDRVRARAHRLERRRPAGPARHAAPGGFAFYPALHEPGPRAVLGSATSSDGEAQAAAILRDLARSPATARAHRGQAGAPFRRRPAAARAGAAPGRGLPAQRRRPAHGLPRAGRSAEAWRWRSPSSRRPGTGPCPRCAAWAARDPAPAARAHAGQLGQPVWRPGSPAGYDDSPTSWMAPDC
jgi:uncharacterized membrane protein